MLNEHGVAVRLGRGSGGIHHFAQQAAMGLACNRLWPVRLGRQLASSEVVEIRSGAWCGVAV
jgi:hypothetical protein